MAKKKEYTYNPDPPKDVKKEAAPKTAPPIPAGGMYDLLKNNAD